MALAVTLLACGESAAGAETTVPAAGQPTARVAESVAATPVATPEATPEPAQEATPEPTPEEASAAGGAGDVANGQQRFRGEGCVGCHGFSLQGAIGPKLAGRTPADLTDERIRTQVRNGGEIMPQFPFLSDTEINDIIAYIRSVS